jgi:hypothetical protein
MTLAEVAALLYPQSPAMQQRYIAARSYVARVRRKVVIGRHTREQQFVPRSTKQAFGS